LKKKYFIGGYERLPKIKKQEETLENFVLKLFSKVFKNSRLFEIFPIWISWWITWKKSKNK